MSEDKVLRTLRRVSNRETRALVLGAIKAGLRYRLTTNGIMFYGPDGKCVALHFTASDPRAHLNQAARLRSIGYHPPKKGSQ